MTKTFTLYTKHGEWAVEPERIACNDIILSGEYNPHKVKLWVLGNEYGPCGAVWAGDLQDALDELCDQGLAGGLLLDDDFVADMDEEERDALGVIGNASEPADLTHLWAEEVIFKSERDMKLLLALAEARGSGVDFLE